MAVDLELLRQKRDAILGIASKHGARDVRIFGSVARGEARVGERSWVGAGATLIQGISIGADVTVGAGAVVIRDVPDGQTVVGVPARSIGRGRRDATLGNPP
jgi:acetyltransferase-like isoleucine patch superfamily enzyme